MKKIINFLLLLKTRIRSSQFAGHLLTLISGNTLAQAITVGVYPIITRLYLPEYFGIFTVISSTTAILAVFSTGKYENAIIAAKKDSNAFQCAILILVISLTSSIGIFSIIAFFRNDIAIFLGIQDSKNWLFSIPVLVFLFGVNQSLYFWFNRKKAYKRLAGYQVLNSMSNSGSTIFFGLLNFGTGGLILGGLIGRLLSVGALGFFAFLDIQKEGLNTNYDLIKRQAKKYRDFPKFLIPSGLIEVLASRLHIIFFSFFFSMAIVGALGLYQKVIRLPVSLIGNSIRDVFKQRASGDLHERGECKKLFWKVAMVLTGISFFPFLVLAIFSVELFSFIFGEEWKIAGEYAQILSFSFFLGFIVSPLSSLIFIAEKQKYDLGIQIFLIISTGVGISLGYYLNDPKLAIVFFTIAYCLKYIIEFIIAYKISTGSIKR